MGNPPKSLLLRQPKNLDNEIILKRLNLYSIKFRIEMSGQTNHNYSLTWNRRVTPSNHHSRASVGGFGRCTQKRQNLPVWLLAIWSATRCGFTRSCRAFCFIACRFAVKQCMMYKAWMYRPRRPKLVQTFTITFYRSYIIPIIIIIHTSLYTKTIRYIYHHAIIAESLSLKIWHEKCFTRRNKTER